MSDITTVWNETAGDWVLLGAALQAGGDLETAVLLSIFSDRVADPDDAIPDGSADPRGWWGDAFAAAPIGSKLWQFDRSKQTPAVLAGVKNALAEALAWLVDDGVAASVDVQASYFMPGALGAVVTIVQPDGRSAKISAQTAWGS
jgi:phage gp46-like protein